MTPEEEAQLASYYSSAGPNMSVAPAPVPASNAADYYAPSAPQVSAPSVSSAPGVDPAAAYYANAQFLGDADAPGFVPPQPAPPDGAMMSKAPPNMSVQPPPNMSGGPAREPTSFSRGGTGGDPYAAPREPESFKREMKGGVPVGKGGGGKGNADPFGVNAANKALLGTYDDEKRATEKLAGAEADKNLLTSEARERLAREQADDAMIARLEEEAANKKFDSHMSEIQTQLDEVKSRKLDPFKKMKDEPALAVAAVVEGIVKGFYEGMSGKTLPSEVDRILQLDYDAQEKNLANDRANINEQMSLLAQQRQVFKDHQLAKMQYKNLQYEGLKQAIEAESARYDSPIIAARAEQAWTMIDRQQKTLDRDLKQRAQDQARAAAAAAAAQARAARKEMIDTQLKLIELGIKDKEAEGKAGKERRGDQAELSKRLADPALVKDQQVIDDLTSKVVNEKGEYDKTKGVPGVGLGSDLREAIAPRPSGVDILRPDAWIAHGIAGLDDEERIGRQEWERAGLAYQNLVTGSGGGEKEAVRIASAFAGAKTAAEQANAVRLANEVLRDLKAKHRAGFDEDVVDEFDARTQQERQKLKPAGRSKP